MACGCTSDEFEPETPAGQQQAAASAEVIIQIPVGYSLDEDESRAAPPGVGGGVYNPLADEQEALRDIEKVDRVKIVAFRCAKGSTEFIHDPANDTVLNVKYPDHLQQTDNGHKHLIARHTIQKEEGCRYRIVALAYSSTTVSSFPSEAFALPAPGDDSWFTLNFGNSGKELYDDFMLKLNENKNAIEKWKDFKTVSTLASPANYKYISDSPKFTPQLFFGVCTSSSGSEIIDYFDYDEYGSKRSDLPITGILKRGMAKVDLVITPRVYKPSALVSCNPMWIAVLADNPRLSSKLTSYDDFLPQAERDNTDENYQLVAYLPVETKDFDTPQHITMWFLPGKTRLAIRVRNKYNAGFDYLRNGKITTSNDEGFGNPTGVLSPNLIDGEFYFRRNHKYTIIVSQPDNILENKSLK